MDPDKDVNSVIGDPNSLIGKCPKYKDYPCVGTMRGLFHAHLAMLGKTNVTKQHPPERVPLGYPAWNEVQRIDNPVFVYEMKQLSDRNEARMSRFRQDLQSAIGLKHELFDPPRFKPDRHWDDRIQSEKDRLKIDICADKYTPLKAELLEIAKEASVWIRESGFLDNLDVLVSSRSHFEDIIKSWMDDPCETRAYEEKLSPDMLNTVNVLRGMGVDFTYMEEETFQELPPWSQVTKNYGSEPKILGLEICHDYRRITSEKDRSLGPAGLYSTGTTLLPILLSQNCMMPGADAFGQRADYQVPWGKHNSLSQRLNYTVDGTVARRRNKTSVLPIATVRHPYTWMTSMCKHSYEMSYLHDKSDCPKNVSPPISGEHYGRKISYKSLIHMWRDWNLEYFSDESAIPRLMVRHEDLVFRPKEVVQKICDCVGGTFKEDFSYQVEKANIGVGHGTDRSDLVTAWVKYGKPLDIFKSMYLPEDLELVRQVMEEDNGILDTFGYQI